MQINPNNFFKPTKNIEKEYFSILKKHIASISQFMKTIKGKKDIGSINNSIDTISSFYVANMTNILYKIYLKTALKTTSELCEYTKSYFNKNGLHGDNLSGFSQLLKNRDSLILELKSYSNVKFDSIPYIEFQSWIKQNVDLIKDVDTQLKNNIARIVESQYRLNLSESTTEELIRKELYASGNPFDVALRRAKGIAFDQINKLRGRIEQYNQQQVLKVSRYLWETKRDDRVRKDHRVLQGVTCFWDDPTKVIINNKVVSKDSIGGVNKHPGEPIKCRCLPIPLFL
jgi:hypothetical protein